MQNTRRWDTQSLAIRKKQQQNGTCAQAWCTHALKVYVFLHVIIAKRSMKPKPMYPWSQYTTGSWINPYWRNRRHQRQDERSTSQKCTSTKAWYKNAKSGQNGGQEMDCRSTLDHMFPITHTGTQPCWQLEKNKLLHGTCSDRSGERGMRMAGANNQKGCNRGSCPEEGTTEGLMAPRNRAAPRPNLQPQQVQLCFLSPGPCQALCLYPPRLDGVQGGKWNRERPERAGHNPGLCTSQSASTWAH